MVVYIVEHGERHEGGSVMAVYLNRKQALKEAAIYAEKKSAEYVQHLGDEFKLEEHPEEKDSETLAYWTYGCDFVSVARHRVIENK